MRKIHIALVTSPIASHLNPLLPIVCTLARRGHRVTCATSDAFAARLSAVGVEVLQYRFGALTAQTLEEDGNAYCRLAINTLAATLSFYEQHKPDVVIYDMTALAGPVLARRLGIPAIKTTPDQAFSKAAFERQIADPGFRAEVLASSAKADLFFERHGIGIRDFIFHREQLNIHTMPRDFEPCEDAIDSTCFFAGRCAGEQQPFGEWRNDPRDHRPLVLVATSKSYLQGSDYFRMCVAALCDLKGRVILSVGEDSNAAALPSLPDNFEVVTRTSHTRILPHASLLVFMGGGMAANEAAYHGVPWVAASLGIAELEWLSDILARLGVGVHLKGSAVSAADLRMAIHNVLENDTIRKRAAQFQRRVRREAGAEETANRIEDFLDDNRILQSF